MEPVKLKDLLLSQKYDVKSFIEDFSSEFVELSKYWEYSLVFVSKLNKLLIESEHRHLNAKHIAAIRQIAKAHAKYREGLAPLADQKTLKALGADKISLLTIDQMPLDLRMTEYLKQVNSKVQKDDLGAISYMQQHGLDVNQKDRDGLVLLSICAQNGSEKCTFALLKAGANPHLSDSMGNTPLHWSCAMDKPRIASILLYFGSNVDAANHTGVTPLMLALGKSNLVLAQKLMDYGADIGAKDWKGNTALHKAVSTKNKEVAQFLVQCGASLDERNKDGLSPLMICNRMREMQDFVVWCKKQLNRL